MSHAIIGYARTSTVDQVAGFEAQLRDLKEAACVKVFQEQVSSVDVERPQLEALLDYAREGDTLVVTKLDRLARSMFNLMSILERLRAKGVELRVLALNLDTATPTGKLMLNMMGSIAEFERELMLERQREGISKAKAEGKYTGRKPTAMAKAAEVKRLRAEGKTAEAIAEVLDISRTSVFRALKGAAA
ncbi:DNA invertase [Ensifer sp. NM-2]|uniref:recombinase family protein n=1 Tax=Ensifer sp. NM-2 TaxID=2109730 RepID=UPI000D11B4CB|nr:recombinase family protein [Ensifer sp. NM-2]PSS67078.1 DNA invertase [Ensifer sp. NM-2]